MHIGIAGAGLLGRLTALELVRAGHRVEVFDPAPDALARGAAGWTAAGMLSPVAELECADDNVFNLGLRSLELWPQIVDKLPQKVDLTMNGSVLLAHRQDAGAARRVVDLLTKKSPPDASVQPLSDTALRDLEPAVFDCPHAWFLPKEGHIDTTQAMSALGQAATDLGVRWHWNASVLEIKPRSLKTGADWKSFDWVFDLRGVGAKPDLPIRGVRGEIFWLQTTKPVLNRPVRLLHPRHRVYLVPRADNIVVVGATEIESEDRSPVSLRSTVELLAAAHSVIPELAESRIIHSETNLRPALPDNLPQVNVDEGLTRINGLFRHGWLLAPALVEQVLKHPKFV